SVTCKIRIEAHIVPKMRIGLLIGTDNMKPERMVVDLDEGRIRFSGHNGAHTPLFPSFRAPKPYPKKIVATEQKTIRPRQDVSVPFWRKDKKPGYFQPGRDYLFEPSHPKLPLYAALLSDETKCVIAHNINKFTYHLEKGEVLGTLVELLKHHAMTAGVGDPLLALDGGESPLEANSSLSPSTNKEQTTLANGVIIAGSKA
ncbi:kinase-regulated stress-responsive transcription factor skn7, partial [Ascosphaera pollenicola]